jgi:hypothetical protein
MIVDAATVTLIKDGRLSGWSTFTGDFSIHRLLAALPLFVPQGKFYAIPEPKLVVNGAKVVRDNVPGRAHDFCHLIVLEPLRDQFDDSLLGVIEGAVSVAFWHSWLPERLRF